MSYLVQYRDDNRKKHICVALSELELKMVQDRYYNVEFEPCGDALSIIQAQNLD